MGCAGSNPLPGGDAIAANGRAAVNASLQMPAADETIGDKACSIVQRVVNVDDVVKKIQDVTGSMENLMDETQEKLGSLFGKVEQKAEDVEQTVENEVHDSTTMPEKPIVREILLLAAEETKIIPIDIIKSELLTNEDNLEMKTKEESTDIEVQKEDKTHKDNTVQDEEEETQNKEEEKFEEENIEEKEKGKVEEEE